MSNFYSDVICKSPHFGSLVTVNDMALLEPITRAAVQAIIVDAKAQGVLLHVTETYRSQARQARLFKQGLTQLRSVGCHGYGLAADLMIVTSKGLDPDGGHYDILRRLAEKHGLISGSDWGEPHEDHDFRDYDHVQRIAVKRQSALFTGLWYPDSRYSPLVDLGRVAPEK